MTNEVSEILRGLSPEQRCGLSWGDRGDGQHWHARWRDRTTIGNGGPYRTAAQAISAVLDLEVRNNA